MTPSDPLPTTSTADPQSYTREMVAASPNNLGYFERREELWRALQRHGYSTVAELTQELGWSRYEIAAKLTSLKRTGIVDNDNGVWYAWEEMDG